jgi:hypothetical protein
MQKTKQKLWHIKAKKPTHFVDGKPTDKVTTINYIVHMGCEGRYLGITGRKKAEGQLIYPLKMWHVSCFGKTLANQYCI